MPKLDLTKVPNKTGSIYPAPHGAKMAGRSSLRLGQAAGLTQFGVNLVALEPGARSSLRHWHLNEDEFVMVVEGNMTLLEEGSETPMGPGDCAGFKAGTPNGHCFINHSESVAKFLVIGSKATSEIATYPDDNMIVTIRDGSAEFTLPDGAPLPSDEQP